MPLQAHSSNVSRMLSVRLPCWDEEEAEHYFPCFCFAHWEFGAVSSLPWCSESQEAKGKVAAKGYSWMAMGPALVAAAAPMAPCRSCPGRAGQSQVPATICQMPFLLVLTWGGDSVVPTPAKQQSHLEACQNAPALPSSTTAGFVHDAVLAPAKPFPASEPPRLGEALGCGSGHLRG